MEKRYRDAALLWVHSGAALQFIFHYCGCNFPAAAGYSSSACSSEGLILCWCLFGQLAAWRLSVHGRAPNVVSTTFTPACSIRHICLYYLLSSIKFRVLFPCESGHTRSGSEISFYVVVYGQHLACSMIPFVFQITLFYILNYIIISSQFDSPG